LVALRERTRGDLSSAAGRLPDATIRERNKASALSNT
jgi:hypothetical protein